MMYTEFISVEGLIRDAAKSVQKLDIYEYERPIGIQIFGNEIDSMMRTAEIVEASDIHRHQNVILHEFAHQLDQLDGYADGTPPLPNTGIYPEWRKVMTEEYNHLCEEAEHAVRDVIDWYGATNPAEFFAVTTESFFCNPLALKKAHEKLYNLFIEFYQIDPGSWRHK